MTTALSTGRPTSGLGGPEWAYHTIRDLLHRTTGIDLGETKRDLVRSRLAARLRTVGVADMAAYAALVTGPGGQSELLELIDALTTNKTAFFREDAHFDALGELLADLPARDRGPTVWSAGCSTGEEAYSLAMVMAEAARTNGGSPGRVLATDLSRRAIEEARRGVYSRARADAVPADFARRYLEPSGDARRVTDEVRHIVRFARHNLVSRWPMTGPFDAIFCRNVMIYFDAETRAELLDRFVRLLSPSGHLFVGHTESLATTADGLRHVQPAVYRVEAA